MKAVYTICTPSHIAQAKTLIRSVLEHNRDYKAFICLFNSDAFALEELKQLDYATIIDAEAISIPVYKKMKEQYNPFELSCALKPYIADYILEHYKPQQVVYFDSDILVLNQLFEVPQSRDICLTLHYLSLKTWDDGGAGLAGRRSIERNSLRGGVFNGGFFSVKDTDIARSFLSWWKEVLVDGCYNNVSKGLFTDQLWLNIVPSYFAEDLQVLRDPGYNIAYWNLYERMTVKTGDGYNVRSTDGIISKLVFFHFSGYKIGAGGGISVYDCPYTFETRSELKGLFERYDTAVLENGFILYTGKYKTTLSRPERIKRKIKKAMRKLLNKK
ncbi:glycosyltransferase family protein [Chitinophaga tropicalis]|uniref:Glycosyl transferase n=1 Tax=Chitinophaga tropicalis TaxID=2683588 RepID=A0A7K1TZ87_9BACT|nr:hypothetical protein [Chitinophaga tropicalis]MVT07431.1 hypothetical protein [Chitinophaga tropicalis]